MRWAIYYGDGSRWTDQDGQPSEAPPWDVQAVAQESERVGKIIIDRWDYYIFRDGEWYGADICGLFDCLAHCPGCIVRFARTRSDEDYAAALHRAQTDPYLAPKSGRDGRRER